MDPALKMRLRNELDRFGPEFGLDNTFFPSFIRYTQYRAPLSAADVVYCLTALIEIEGQGDGQGEEEEFKFHEAYQVLCGNDDKKLQEGIQLSMSLQKAVFRLGISMLDLKGPLQYMKHFRYVILRSNWTSLEDRIFMSPVSLSKLGWFVVEVNRETGRWEGDRCRPLVLVAERRNTFIGKGFFFFWGGGLEEAEYVSEFG